MYNTLKDGSRTEVKGKNKLQNDLLCTIILFQVGNNPGNACNKIYLKMNGHLWNKIWKMPYQRAILSSCLRKSRKAGV